VFTAASAIDFSGMSITSDLHLRPNVPLSSDVAMANMALPERFSLLNSELNNFLFASMGEGQSGAPLSVLSALTRLGIDPWAEGARLSNLPKEAATRALVALIALFPEDRRSLSDVGEIAARLVDLLPKPRSAVSFVDAVSAGAQRKRGLAMWLLLGLGLVLVNMAMRGLLPWQ
jgi:hypothetical protein